MCQIGQLTRRNPRSETGVGRKMSSLVGIFLCMCILVNTVSCKSAIDRKQQNDNEKLVRHEGDNAYDWKLSTDNFDFYKILKRLDYDDIIAFLENTSYVNDMGFTGKDPIKQRHKRNAIFGRDDRKQIATSLHAEEMPYAASVRISTGCTGTLIGPKYVLTAAHCAFKGTRATKKVKKLKVGFLNLNERTRWRKVRRVHVAKQWFSISNHRDRLKHDFAVLELRRRYRRTHMTPVPYHTSQGNLLQINGFPGDKRANTLWHTSCNVGKVWNGFLINRCDFTKGMSGAGSYLLDKRRNYVVRGIVIASVTFERRNRKERFNVVNQLTREKTRLICQWMKAGNCNN